MTARRLYIKIVIGKIILPNNITVKKEVKMKKYLSPDILETTFLASDVLSLSTTEFEDIWGTEGTV